MQTSDSLLFRCVSVCAKNLRHGLHRESKETKAASVSPAVMVALLMIGVISWLNGRNVSSTGNCENV